LLVPSPALKDPLTPFCLAQREVCHVGEAIAVVVAESRYLAEDAAASVQVDYSPLAAASDCREALSKGAAVAHSHLANNAAAVFKVGYGNVDAQFAGAAKIVQQELWQHRGCGHALECRGVLAEVNPRDKSLTLFSSTQTPHLEKRLLAQMLERSPD